MKTTTTFSPKSRSHVSRNPVSRNHVLRNHAAIGISESVLTPAMRDFLAGMHFLHRYAARCHADAEIIGRDNLRLLHRTLMGDAHYRTALAEAMRSSSQRGLPVSRKLFTAVEIEAEIVSLQQDSALRLTDHPNQMGLLMMLSGRAHLTGNTPRPQTFSRKMHGWLTGSKPALKSQDVIWEKQNGPEPQTLIATANNCVLLRVRLPLPTFSMSGDDIPRRQVGQRIAAAG